MKDLFTVMKFTMKDMVKRKSFIISTIIFLVMIVVGFNVPKILKSITPNFEFSLEQTDEKANGNVFAMMLLSIVLFYAIYFCAYQVSSSITTEKTSKIIETLVTSTSPKTIVLGKTIGIGIVGLLQMILLVGTALISAKAFLEPGMIEQVLDMSAITPYLGIVTIIYFILGYFTYALHYAICLA